MYNHSNLSAASNASGRRISSNNPFRNALLQEERATTSRSTSPKTADDIQYKKWLDKRIEEESEESRLYNDDEEDNYSSYSDNSFAEGDETLNAPVPSKLRTDSKHRSATRPQNTRTSSDNSRNSYNPFSTYVRKDRSNSNTPTNTPTNQSFPNKPSYNAPPSYDEVVGKKYGKNEYPKDEKSHTRVEVNPFPDDYDDDSIYETKPRRSKTLATRRNAPNSSKPSPAPRLNPDSMTNTTTTRIMSDGRVRSKSTGDPSYSRGSEGPRRSHRSRHDDSKTHEHRSHREHREHREHRDHRSREHRHHKGDHDHEHDNDYDYDYKPRRSRKKFVQQNSKNLDTIDKLDVTGFFGGGKFHHDGPFDACTPQRNKDTKAAPVAAFPADGPNNSIKGMGPNNSKDDQYDMVFGIDKANNYDNEYPAQSEITSSDTLKRGYTNGTIIRKADPADLESIAPGARQPALEQVDAGITAKLHGDTTLGLGSSTFMDGAPAYGATSTHKESSGLGRKKTILGRMKTIVRK